jgi:hypothetical protein
MADFERTTIGKATSCKNQLKTLLEKVGINDIPVSHFLEPDIGFELTAIAFEGTDKAKKLTSSLSLALKNYNKQ